MPYIGCLGYGGEISPQPKPMYFRFWAKGFGKNPDWFFFWGASLPVIPFTWRSVFQPPCHTRWSSRPFLRVSKYLQPKVWLDHFGRAKNFRGEKTSWIHKPSNSPTLVLMEICLEIHQWRSPYSTNMCWFLPPKITSWSVFYGWSISYLESKRLPNLDQSTVNYIFFKGTSAWSKKNATKSKLPFPAFEHQRTFPFKVHFTPPFFGSQKTDVFFFQRHIEGLLQQTLILKRFQGTLLLFTSRLGEVFSDFFFANKDKVWGEERWLFFGGVVVYFFWKKSVSVGYMI